ncbi:MAG: hypothetical protein C4B58_10275 [Deltaproteobacteria bacterium]|nr:MAG: hypothetical protein C4B58_10275 [Deltaproteobacteria bacterium]
MSVHDEIRQFIIDNFLMGQDSDSLKDDSSFLEEGVIDSTGVLELVGFLEENYEIKVEDEELIRHPSFTNLHFSQKSVYYRIECRCRNWKLEIR